MKFHPLLSLTCGPVGLSVLGVLIERPCQFTVISVCIFLMINEPENLHEMILIYIFKLSLLKYSTYFFLVYFLGSILRVV